MTTEENYPFFCITLYHPHNPPIKAIIQKNWHILETDPRLVNFCHKEVIVGHKRPQNIRDILVSFRLCYPPAPPKPKGIINPSKLCKNTKCRYCPLLDLSGIAKSTPLVGPTLFHKRSHANSTI